jgi:hypothetical protein
MRKAALLAILMAWAAFAADITGTWKGTTETGGRGMEVGLTVKASGGALTGTSRLYGNDYEIQNGKIDGDNISFRSRSQYGTAVYEGTVNGDEIEITISIGPGQEMRATLKRVK